MAYAYDIDTADTAERDGLNPSGAGARRAIYHEPDDITVIDSPHAMRALATQWRRLEDDAAAPFNFFQSYEWNAGWVERFMVPAGGPRLMLVAGYAGGRLKMLWPLMVERDGPFVALKWLGDPFPQYGGVLIAPDVDRRVWLARAWDRIVALPGIDTVELRGVRTDDPVRDHLAGTGAAVFATRLGCFIELSDYGTHADLVAGLPSRRRRLRRKLRRHLEDLGPLQFDTMFEGPGFADAIRDTLHLKRAWLKQTSQISRAVSDPRLDALLLSLAGGPPAGPRVVANVLSCAGAAAAYEIALHYRGQHYLYIIAQAPEFAAHSPSKVAVDEAQAAAIAGGMKVFDLLPPEDRYKYDLSDSTIAVADYALPTSHWGRVRVAYLSRLRPLIKSVYLNKVAPLLAGLRHERQSH